MGFGVHLALGTDKEKFKKANEGLDGLHKESTEEKVSTQAPAPSSPSRFARTPQDAPAPQNTASRFRRSPSASSISDTNKPAENKSSIPPQNLPRPSVFTADMVYEDMRAQEEGASTAVAKREKQKGPTPYEQKCLRVRRLVQEVAEFKKWDEEQTLKAEKECLRDPDSAYAKYGPVYKEEVQPFRAKGVHSLEEAMQKHPDAVVFLLSKKDKQSVRVVSVSEAGSQSLLHGARLESVPKNNTPFPAVVFPKHETTSTAAPLPPKP